MMTHKVQALDRFGNPINEDRALRDGERVKVGLLFMDSGSPDIAEITRRAVADAGDGVLHRPGPAPGQIADARDAAYEERCKALSDAWRNPAAPAPAPVNPATVTAADVAAARAERDRRLSDAWKGGATC